jgi:preprotein translocase subunit SecE
MKKGKKMQSKTELKVNSFQNSRKKKSNYFREVQQELKKVTWTTKEELKTCTKIVIGATFMLGFGIYFSDLIIQHSLQLISSIAKYIGG